MEGAAGVADRSPSAPGDEEGVLVSIPKELVASVAKQYPGLKTLNLSGNNIRRIQNLEPLSALTRLDLSNNALTAIEGLEGLPQLADLHVGGNEITSISPALRSLGKLRHLDLSANRLKLGDWMSTLAALPSLRHLRLAGNPVGASNRYRQIVAAVLPQLLTLDGEPLEDGALLSGHPLHGKDTRPRTGSAPGSSQGPDDEENMSAWLDAEDLAGNTAAGSRRVGGVRSSRSVEPIPVHGLEGMKLDELAASVLPHLEQHQNIPRTQAAPQKTESSTDQQEHDKSHTFARPARWSPGPSRIPHAPAHSALLQLEKRLVPLSQRGPSSSPVAQQPQLASQRPHPWPTSTSALQSTPLDASGSAPAVAATQASGSTHTGTHRATAGGTHGAGQPPLPSTAARPAGLPGVQQRAGWERQRDPQDQLAWLSQQVGDQQSRINGVEATLRGPVHASFQPVSTPPVAAAPAAGTQCASAGSDEGAAAGSRVEAAASAPARDSAAWRGVGSDDAAATAARPPPRMQPAESPTELQVLADSVQMLRGVVQQQQEQLTRLMASTRPASAQHGDHSNAGASSMAKEGPQNTRNDTGAAPTAGSHPVAGSSPGDSTMHISSELTLAAQQLLRAANAALSPQRDNPKQPVDNAPVELRTKTEPGTAPPSGQEAGSGNGRGNTQESERMLWRTLVVGMQEQFLQVQQLVQVLHHQLCQQRQAVAASAAAATAATQQLVQLQVEHERLQEQLQAAALEQQQLRQALWQAQRLR